MDFFAVNQLFCDFFHKVLKSEKFKRPCEYIKERGISQEKLNQFNLGYCDSSLTEYFVAKEKFDKDTLIELGLLKENNNQTYVFFYDRLIFPIFDQYGRCVAFSGRRLDGEKDYKYINSKASRIFSKKKVLYGLNLNYFLLLKKRFVFLLEGYIDVISLFQYGFENCVCSMGTATTNEQARILRRYADTLIVLYDGDKAGREAAEKAEEIYKKYMKVKKIFLPEEDDPDSFIRKYGTEKLKKYIKERI